MFELKKNLLSSLVSFSRNIVYSRWSADWFRLTTSNFVDLEDKAPLYFASDGLIVRINQPVFLMYYWTLGDVCFR